MTALTYSPGLRFQINSSLTVVPPLFFFEQALLLQLLTKERMPYYRTIGEMKQARVGARRSLARYITSQDQDHYHSADLDSIPRAPR